MSTDRCTLVAFGLIHPLTSAGWADRLRCRSHVQVESQNHSAVRLDIDDVPGGGERCAAGHDVGSTAAQSGADARARDSGGRQYLHGDANPGRPAPAAQRSLLPPLLRSSAQPAERRNQSLGSGVVVDAEHGYVLTNHHVIDKAEEIRVRLHDGRELTAELLGADPDTDVGVLQIPNDKLTAVTIADSERLPVGAFVVAIGNPFGFNQTVTSGIVSALGRSGLGIEGYENFLQTDTSINPGNSGGASGRSARPSDRHQRRDPRTGWWQCRHRFRYSQRHGMASSIMEQIIEYGEVRRGVFGIGIQDLTPNLSAALKLEQQPGAVISQIRADLPAAEAGLEVGDFVVAFGDKPVVNAQDLRTRLALARIGGRIEPEVIRDGSHRTQRVRLADPCAGFVDGRRLSELLDGALFGNVLDDSPLDEFRAVAVGRILQGSPAWETGLREVDVVIEINRVRIKNLKILEEVMGDNDIRFIKLRRNNRLLSLVRRR